MLANKNSYSFEFCSSGLTEPVILWTSPEIKLFNIHMLASTLNAPLI